MLSELFDNIRHTKNSVIPLIQINTLNYVKNINSIEINYDYTNANEEFINLTYSFEIE